MSFGALRPGGTNEDAVSLGREACAVCDQWTLPGEHDDQAPGLHMGVEFSQSFQEAKGFLNTLQASLKLW